MYPNKPCQGRSSQRICDFRGFGILLNKQETINLPERKLMVFVFVGTDALLAPLRSVYTQALLATTNFCFSVEIGEKMYYNSL